ncbi:MAG: nitrous oxide reductase family maturation protein NosD [Acidobacteria bacterium]|jgi:nitrous oxidase accessory protein|nr:nitrous oxide reductase family maturation protein NosD [Acidobacteriota bacterium]
MTALVAASLVAVVLTTPLAAWAQAEHAVTPGQLEGRPALEGTSPLQARVDAAAPGARLEVAAGTYVGDLYIDRPVTLVGIGRPRLVGSGGGSVVRVRADHVTIEGFDIDGQRGGDLGRDSSGVHVAAKWVTIRDVSVVESLFGIYLREADGAVVERCRIRGIAGRDPGEKGSGIHAYNTVAFRFDDNEIDDVRDGLLLQNASRGRISRNRVSDVRYGLHYMFSDDNIFEGNTFERGAAGSAIMYSERIQFRRNRFLRNRGFASVGLLLQQCDDVLAEDNLIADNARGVFLEGTHRVTFRRNVVAGSDAALVMFDSAMETRIEGNLFIGNLSPLNMVGKRSDAFVSGNYWSENVEPDLDGDGISDRPYRLSSVFDHFRGNLTAADLMADGFAGAALGAAETAFPILDPAPMVDQAPLARAPRLDHVPAANPTSRANRLTVLASAAVSVGAAVVLVGGRRARRLP